MPNSKSEVHFLWWGTILGLVGDHPRNESSLSPAKLELELAVGF